MGRFLLLGNCSCIALISYIHVTIGSCSCTALIIYMTAMDGGNAIGL